MIRAPFIHHDRHCELSGRSPSTLCHRVSCQQVHGHCHGSRESRLHHDAMIIVSHCWVLGLNLESQSGRTGPPAG
eukprot:434405-Rhodomonas_salina.1